MGMVGADVFKIIDKTLLCNVEYYRKSPILEK